MHVVLCFDNTGFFKKYTYISNERSLELNLKGQKFYFKQCMIQKPTDSRAGDHGSSVWIINTNMLPAVTDHADDKIQSKTAHWFSISSPDPLLLMFLLFIAK